MTTLHAPRAFPAVLLPLLLAAACGSPAPTQPSAAVPPGDASLSAAAPQAEDSSDVARIRRATARFHDVDAAVAAGYLSPEGRPCDGTPAGTMGVHAANPGLIGTFPFDPLQPEVLLYLPKPGGGFRLVGVEYLQPVLLRNTGTGAVAPWFSASRWPATHTVVNPAPTLFGHTFQGPMPGHVPGMPWHYDLHVWAWAPNPAGMFAQWNPSLQCP